MMWADATAKMTTTQKTAWNRTSTSFRAQSTKSTNCLLTLSRNLSTESSELKKATIFQCSWISSKRKKKSNSRLKIWTPNFVVRALKTQSTISAAKTPCSGLVATQWSRKLSENLNKITFLKNRNNSYLPDLKLNSTIRQNYNENCVCR